MTTPYQCPECGGPLDLDEHAETDEQFWIPGVGRLPVIETRRRPAVVAFCTRCEFAIEVKA